MAATDQHRTDEHSSAVAPDEGRTVAADEGHGAVARNSHVDPHAEPSADWGWHGSFPRAKAAAGWATAAALFLMLIGNHESHVEDLWLIGLGSLLVLMLIGDALKRRRRR